MKRDSNWKSDTAAGESKRQAVALTLEQLNNQRIRVIVVESKDNPSHTGTRYDSGALWLVEDRGPAQPFFLWRGRRSLSLGPGNPNTPTEYGNLTPQRQEIVSKRIERDARVRGITLERAQFRCEISGCKDGSDFRSMDVHHMTRLGDGGGDHTDNTVVLCPPCHSRVHRGIDAVKDAIERKLLSIREHRSISKTA